MKKQIMLFISLLLVGTCFQLVSAPPMLTHNDFYPLHSTLNPFNFLNEQSKEVAKGLAKGAVRERMRFNLTAFGQKASRARDQNKSDVPAGDFRGRWNMVGLLYGNAPTGQTRAALLTTAAAQTYHDGQLLNHPNYTDVNDNLGHFSIPLKYRKIGARFEFSTRIVSDVVITVEGGISDLKQTYSTFDNMGRINLSHLQSNGSDYHPTGASSANVTTDADTIDQYLMDNHELIFEQMGLNVQDHHASGAEDVFVSLVWRHSFPVNKADGVEHDYGSIDSEEWSQFMLTPFFKITGIVGIGKKQDPAKAFSMTMGNNGHHGVALLTGFSMDFYETVEVTWAAGTTHFFKRDIAGFYLPTDERQAGVFPFKTDVAYDPGKTWNFSFTMNAHQFLDKLSCYVQYLFISHSKDKITPITEDSAWKQHVLEDQTKWNIQAVNVGFNYNLSPNMTFGFAWQAPVARRGAYKTNTIALTMAGTF